MANISNTPDDQAAKSTIEKGRRGKWIRRVGGKSKGFRYVDQSDKPVVDREILERIASLVIPPAWKFVRIAPSAGSKIQAVGMDTSGRVQYLYNPKFAEKKQREKFGRLVSFGEHLPKLRKATNADISLDGLPKRKVLAAMLRLINSLYFRVGSEKSAKLFRTYGITTLQNKHLSVKRKGVLEFDFTGKSYVRHRKILVDSELSEIMKELQNTGPKRKLFCFIDDEGKVKPIKPADINAYLKRATEDGFSSKDFRTWGATLLASVRLAEIGTAAEEKEKAKNVVLAVKAVSKELGNTPAVCRSAYIHPTIIAAYEKGITIDQFRPRKVRTIKRIQSDFEVEEASLLKLLRSEGK